ncbi:hypothetical protein B0H21DRAFT_687479 [Amylocystis lapponica]|nr:hypothetical protein B0H21DRAFT_687479 [Amylocystis lapponica]
MLLSSHSHGFVSLYPLLSKTSAPPELDTTSVSRTLSDRSFSDLLASAVLPVIHSNHDFAPESEANVSRTPSDSSISLNSSSVSDHDDIRSIFSSCATNSTRITSSADSDHGPKSDEDVADAITILSRSRSRSRSRPSSEREAGPSTPPMSVDTPSHRRPLMETRPGTYTDEDWAKEIRAPVPIVAIQAAAPASPRRLARPLHPDLLPPISPGAEASDPSGPYPLATPRPVRPRIKSDRSSRHSNRHSRGRMSALWEEDESEYSGVSSTEPSRSSTPIPFSDRSGTSPFLSTPSLAGPPRPRTRTFSGPTDRPSVRAEQPPESPVETPDDRLQDYARQRSAFAAQASSALSSSLPTHVIPAPFPESAASSVPNGYTSLTLPRANYTNSKGKAMAEGRVDLVRAGVAQTSMATVEVVRGAAAAAGGSLTRPRPQRRGSFPLSIARSFSLSIAPKKRLERRSSSRSRRESATPAHLRGALPLPVAFTAHISPPSFVPPSHVLVQVFAVALDGLDSLIVQEKVDAGAGAAAGGSLRKRRAGFIPGRSFVGRAIECGFEVKDEVCKRGEWVIGLTDVRKCGALAEFVLVERHKLYRSPQPRARSSTLFPPRRRSHTRTVSLPTQRGTFASSPLAPPVPLTLEELALLPLAGVPAHRAVRTFVDALASPRRSRDPETRPRALVLQGHDGPGALAVQMLGRRGVRVTVQIPDSAVDDGAGETSDSSDSNGRCEAVPWSRHEQVEARMRGWGADEVCIGTPLGVLERLVEENRSFDAVLDTIGGVDVWEAAQMLLLTPPPRPSPSAHMSQSSPTLSTMTPEYIAAPEPETKATLDVSLAQFTTLVGDMPSRAVPKAQDNLRSGLRSLRRAITTTSGPSKSSSLRALSNGKPKGVKRTVCYSWVSVAADVDFDGEDVRQSLAAVVGMVEEGAMRPWAGDFDMDSQGEEGRVVPFERAPEVFRRDLAGPRGVLKDGGTCVVKIGG